MITTVKRMLRHSKDVGVTIPPSAMRESGCKVSLERVTHRPRSLGALLGKKRLIVPSFRAVRINVLHTISSRTLTAGTSS